MTEADVRELQERCAAGDSRHAAASHLILSRAAGRPHLRTVTTHDREPV